MKKFLMTKSNVVKKKLKKKNNSRKSYPTFLHIKIQEKQLKLKDKFKTKFFSYFFQHWNSERWSKFLPTHCKPQYPQDGPHIIKNTKTCIVTKKNFILSRSNINSHILKSLVEKGKITNFKKSKW